MARRALLFALCLLSGAAHAEDRQLRVVAPWEITSLEPSDTGFIAKRMGVAETLTQVEPDGRVVAGIADRWTVSDDRLSWRFHIAAGRRFHDGTAITAEAVRDSFVRGVAAAESLKAVPIAGVTVEGDTLVIATRTPFSPLPAFLVDWGGVILAPASYAADGRTVAWIGSGPYRVTHRDGDRVLETEAVPDAVPKPAVARARYDAVPLGETRAALVESGEADVAFTLAPVAVARINAGGRAHVETATIPRVRMLTFNTGLPMFADERSRRAISLAIDRAGIAAALLRSPASAATQLFPPVLAEWHDAAQPPIGRDVGQARALLAAAGWTPGPGGVLEKAGQPFRFDTLVPANRPELPPIAAAMQAQLREVGIDMQIKVGPSAGIPQAHRDGSLQAAFLARTYVNVPDPIGTVLPDFASPRTMWASEGWHDDALDAAAADYVASFDPARQAVLRHEIAAILQARLPVVTVSWFEHTVAVSRRVAGVQIDPYETRYLVERMRWAE